MTIDPSTLAPDTPVQIFGGDLLLAHQVKVSRVVRVAEWLPTDEQEVPRDKWATITPGSRVRIEYDDGVIVNGPWSRIRQDFDLTQMARAWVLDEPDADADLIERALVSLQERLRTGGFMKHEDLIRNVIEIVRAEDGAR